MSGIPSIGRLVDIDLREVWASEPYAFTPWLASAENLQFLAESLDLPGLELIRTEHPVDSSPPTSFAGSWARTITS